MRADVVARQKHRLGSATIADARNRKVANRVKSQEVGMGFPRGRGASFPFFKANAKSWRDHLSPSPAQLALFRLGSLDYLYDLIKKVASSPESYCFAW